MLKGARAFVYHRIPALREPTNVLPLLMTYHDRLADREQQLLATWASSDHGLALYSDYVSCFDAEQAVEQLVLTAATLLCFQKLTMGSINPTERRHYGWRLADLDFCLCDGAVLDDQDVIRQICEAMLFRLQGPKPEYLIEILAQALGNVQSTPRDACSHIKHYVSLRMLGWSHIMARGSVKAESQVTQLMEQLGEL